MLLCILEENNVKTTHDMLAYFSMLMQDAIEPLLCTGHKHMQQCSKKWKIRQKSLFV